MLLLSPRRVVKKYKLRGKGEMKFARIREYLRARDSLMQIAEDR